ncbi:CRISPR-associated protein, TIGR03984 family [Thermomonospora echinospora]|uniref:CRISPR-associated protein, TIGR03984 family n=1 Tax=Thermomonospora echinospora TaxID=1992 RepID=A0A1H6AKX1_9ACTN|nr:CRISPR-associated protein Csx19 [Thermomonospora echinospora]SEG48675.1 CRISPR-associated protein, TIGR03984 family [Thermomonospora echinospora]
MNVVLHTAARDGLSFPEVLAYAPDGVALLITPWRYHVALVRDGRVLPHRDEIDLTETFDVRVFNENAELRWLQSGGSGRAVLLTEDATALPADFTERDGDVHAIAVQKGQYLLWGRSVGTSGGWTTLTTERIGAIRVPVDIPRRPGYAALTTREYIARDPRHGNAYVAEERLLGFAPTSITRPRAEDTAS